MSYPLHPHRLIITPLSLALTLALASCGQPDTALDITGEPGTVITQPAPQLGSVNKTPATIQADVSIRATFALDVPEPVNRIAFMPNSVAPWLGQILFLTDRGALYRSTAQGRSTDLISAGPFTDITTLIRDGEPAITLTLAAGSQIGAFIEHTDDGDMKAIAVSQGRVMLKSFCTVTSPDAHGISGLNDGGDLRQLKTTIVNNTIVEITTQGSIKGPKNAQSCAVFTPDRLWTLGSNKLYERVDQKWDRATFKVGSPDLAVLSWQDTPIPLGISPDQQTISALYKGEPLSVAIEDGLSITGTDTVTRLAGTNTSFGGAFSDGLVAVTGTDRSRVILIARDHALISITAFEE